MAQVIEKSMILASALNPFAPEEPVSSVTQVSHELCRTVSKLLSRLSRKLILTRFTTGMKWLCGLVVLVQMNRLGNSWALNHWQFKADKQRWTWSREIAVVTGGCSGIGASYVTSCWLKALRLLYWMYPSSSWIHKMYIPASSNVSLLST